MCQGAPLWRGQRGRERNCPCPQRIPSRREDTSPRQVPRSPSLGEGASPAFRGFLALGNPEVGSGGHLMAEFYFRGEHTDLIFMAEWWLAWGPGSWAHGDLTLQECRIGVEAEASPPFLCPPLPAPKVRSVSRKPRAQLAGEPGCSWLRGRSAAAFRGPQRPEVLTPYTTPQGSERAVPLSRATQQMSGR